jgi:hypothetical protein
MSNETYRYRHDNQQKLNHFKPPTPLTPPQPVSQDLRRQTQDQKENTEQLDVRLSKKKSYPGGSEDRRNDDKDETRTRATFVTRKLIAKQC